MIKFIFHFCREYYLTMAKWVNDQRICAIWTLRSQNVSLISFCDWTVALSNGNTFFLIHFFLS
jgi:hypothetical protein